MYDTGIDKGKLDVARNMKLESIPLDTIVKVTGLSNDVIEKL
jgi:hypothetical protein